MTSQTLLPRPLVVIDTETTGLPGQSWAAVVELGAVALDTAGQEVAWFNTLVQPAILDERCDRALEVNGITREQLKGACTAEAALAAFMGWSKCVPGGAEISAYNMTFDKKMVEGMGEAAKVLPWADYCLMRKAANGGKAKKLSVLAAELEVEVCQPLHRALSDARTAAQVWVKLKQLGRV